MALPITAHAQAGAACNAQGTPAERNACVVQQWQQADTALTMLYGDVMTALSAHERPLLRSNQNQWLRTRQSQCRQAVAAHSQRSDYDALYYQCLLDRIAQRRTALMHWLHHGEAPPATPAPPAPEH